MPRLLVTGAAGFIGSQAAAALLDRGAEVLGIDALTPYFDEGLKAARLATLTPRAGFEFRRLDLADAAATAELFAGERFAAVLHLAAQAGVRFSLDHPELYVASNLAGLAHVLEGCRRGERPPLLFASSSSVYGAGCGRPARPSDPADKPLSFYAATKRSGELLASSYSTLFGLPVTVLRFFTVYGPWGRPDMALYRFAERILAGEPLELYNRGEMRRDFTYVGDAVAALLAALDRPAAGTPPFRVYNVASGRPVALVELVEELERQFGLRAPRRLLPLQPGDAPETHGDIHETTRDLGWSPQVSFAEGVARFAAWYRQQRG